MAETQTERWTANQLRDIVPMHPAPATVLATLVGFKILDAYTTLIGFRAGLVETNPLAAWAISLLGPVAGLFAMATVALAILIGGIEYLATAGDNHGYDPDGVRFIAYLFPASLYLLISYRNLLLIYA